MLGFNTAAWKLAPGRFIGETPQQREMHLPHVVSH